MIENSSQDKSISNYFPITKSIYWIEGLKKVLPDYPDIKIILQIGEKVYQRNY